MKESNRRVSAGAGTDALAKVRELLSEVVRLRHEGCRREQLAHATGACDGYIRALLDLGVCSEREVLAAVQGARFSADGPALAEVSEDGMAPVVAA